MTLSTRCMARRLALTFGVVLFLVENASSFANPTQEQLSALGRLLFFSTSLSDDRAISCSSCHVPEHAFADPRPVSIGAHGAVGTRNAPSLVGVADDEAFFWDGRRTKLDLAVLDPFTNPTEFALASRQDVIERIQNDVALSRATRKTFGESRMTLADVASALAAFVRSLKTGTSPFDEAMVHRANLSLQAEQGRTLFEGIAGCTNCHLLEQHARFSDGEYHFTGLPTLEANQTLSDLVDEVRKHPVSEDALGAWVLSDRRWASLGRFVVTQRPSDIGAFRTPSLRNVALTAPYMHDGHITTLEEAVDHEIYYRAQFTGHAVQITENERAEICAFLRTLSDRPVALTIK